MDLQNDATTTAAPDGTVSTGSVTMPTGTITISSGDTQASTTPAPPSEPKPYWPEDWRQKIAEYAGAGNPKAVEKELRRLESMNDPSAVFARWRDMENTWASRRFVKLPGEDAKPEDIAEYHKALGVPETPEEYLKDLQLPDGLTLSEDSKPAIMELAKSMHAAGAPPKVVAAAVTHILQTQDQHLADLDEQDDKSKRESMQTLKNEFGNAYQRYTNNIGTLFQHAPGGMDATNEQALFARLLGGRTSDGVLIGNDADVVRWLVSLANNLNPTGSVVEDAASGRTIEEEIASYERRMKGRNEQGAHDPSIRAAYFKDEAAQARYRELISTRDKIRARAR